MENKKKPKILSKIPHTTWGHVADWYDEHLLSSDTYHEKVVLPNIMRLVMPQKDELILDVPCGQGYFATQFAESGAKVIGVDIAKELVTHAERRSGENIRYIVAPSHKLSGIKDKSVDKIVVILGIQNIEKVDDTFAEFARVLKPKGELHITMNHPAFRIPRTSSWEWDDKKKVEYRRVEQYMSESHVNIDMHPGKYVKDEKDREITVSFHRPLQFYFKLLGKHGLAVDRLEEWTSHRKSDSGPRKDAENKARKEFPLFLYLRARILTK